MTKTHSTRLEPVTLRSASRDPRRGNTLVSVVALLLILGGAGGYNYHRNYQKEMAEKTASAFSGYSDADLAALKQAYEQEAAANRARYETARAHRVRTNDGDGLLGQNIDNFEQARRVGNAVREATADLASREARLQEIDKELARRGRLGAGFSVHVQRLISI